MSREDMKPAPTPAEQYASSLSTEVEKSFARHLIYDKLDGIDLAPYPGLTVERAVGIAFNVAQIMWDTLRANNPERGA